MLVARATGTATRPLTQGLHLAQHPQHQEGLEKEKQGQEDERRKLVQDIEANVAIRIGQARIKFTGPAEASFEGDVAGPDEQRGGGEQYQSDGESGAVIHQLKADDGIHQQDPGRGHDQAQVNAGEDLH